MTQSKTDSVIEMLKPLFIPLKTEYYEAFERGEKTEELRLYGARWNHKTCVVGREVILSKGYGKSNRMKGRIFAFAKLSGRNLTQENQKSVKEVYGSLDVAVAFIGIDELNRIGEKL